MAFLRITETASRMAALERRLAEIAGELETMNDHLARLVRRESQLRAVLERDAELDRYQSKLDDTLARPGMSSHVERAVRQAELLSDPFPHAVIEAVFPDDLYACLLRGLPPLELFADRPTNKQQLQVPFRLAPAYSRRVWRHLTSVVIPEYLAPAIVAKFREPLDDWLRLNWPAVPPASVEFQSSDGRVLLRRRGYRIPPHRDPKWGFLTCILYLARREDSERWGTQIYSVDGDEEALGAAPHWIDPERCRYVGDVAFRPNRILVFLNSVGAHGAHIPDDAEPETLERYIFQFRIAPTVEAMGRLKSTLPEDRRPFWAGKAGDY
ncbi:MAG: hypothetical protein ACRD3C_22895 [Vicinamibacterales bacterium]